MSKTNGLPRGDFNMPPGVRAAEVDGDYDPYDGECSVECGCTWSKDGGWLKYCSVHQVAPAMLAALKALQREVHEYRLLDIRKRFSLCTADAQASTAIAKAEGRYRNQDSQPPE